MLASTKRTFDDINEILERHKDEISKMSLDYIMAVEMACAQIEHLEELLGRVTENEDILSLLN